MFDIDLLENFNTKSLTMVNNLGEPKNHGLLYVEIVENRKHFVQSEMNKGQ